MRARSLHYLLRALIAFVIIIVSGTSAVMAQSSMFVTGYFANHSVNSLPPEDVDYSALTHIIHFSTDVSMTAPYLLPLVSGADSAEYEGSFTGRNIQAALITSAHARGVKVLMSVANVNFYGGNNAIMTYITQDSGRCQTFVNATLAYARRKGYDGVDLNWEWPNSGDEQGYTRMMRMFRRGLDQWPIRGLLTHALYPTAGFGTGATIRGAYNIPLLNQYMDQHNVELYGLHALQTNSRLGYTFALAEGTVEAAGGFYDAITLSDSFPHHTDQQNCGPLGLVRGGWDKKKMGVGLGFLYYHLTSPSPLLIGGTNFGTWQNRIRYNYGDVIGNLFGRHPRLWDDKAKMPYKKWQDANGYNFLTYEDSLSLYIKAKWAKDNNFGGIMIYELGTGYITKTTWEQWYIPGYTGNRDPLLKGIKNAVFGGGLTPPPQTAPSTPSLSSPINGATNQPTSVGLSWASSNGATNYWVQVAPSSAFTTLLVNDSNLTTLSRSLSGLAASTTYYWRVRARNSAGTSGWSGTWSFTTGNAPPPQSSNDQWLYDDALVSPWLNWSWNSTNTFNSTEEFYSGGSATKTVQNSWGALQLHSGEYGTPIDVNPADYTRLEFAVYNTTPGLILRIYLGNDATNAFPTINLPNVLVNEWSVISIPMSQLNPNNYPIHRVYLQNFTSTTKTYFVDDIRFVGNVVVVPPPVVPTLTSPPNAAANQPDSVTLGWTASTGVTNYRVQVASNSSFGTLGLDDSSLTSTSRRVSGLSAASTYYWRVAAKNAGGWSDWSETWSFTTAAPPPPPTSDLWIYQDALRSPWVDASWFSTNTLSSDETVFEGSAAIKTIENPWGALRLRSGSWNSKVDVNTGAYRRVEFAVYSVQSGITLNVGFHNDMAGVFPSATYYVPGNQWVVVSFPIAQLNPNGLVINDLTIQNFTASIRTFFVDKVRLVGGTDAEMGKTAARGTEEANATPKVPAEYALEQNFPNPFNPSTTIRYALPEASNVVLKVYNAVGQEVATLKHADEAEGFHSFQWNTSSAGNAIASGIYFYRLEATSLNDPSKRFIEVKKMTVLK